MATTVRIPGVTAVEAPTHPIDELRAARRDLLAALQGRPPSDLLVPGVEGERCGRDVLLRIAAWLRELARLVPDLAIHGYQRRELFDPLCVLEPDWSAWTAAQIAPHRRVRPEAAVAAFVTAHARLLAALEGLDNAALRRRGPTRFGVETSGWELLVAEAAREREHAARLMAHTRQPALGAVALEPGRVSGGRDDKTWMSAVTQPDRRRQAAPGHRDASSVDRGATHSR